MKLLKLKKWLSLADAASHLSTVFQEPVSDKDVLQLCLDADLKLSCLLRHDSVRSVHEFYDFTLLKWSKELFSKLRGNSDYPEMQGSSETEVLITLEYGEEVRELTGPYNINLENGQAIRDWILSYVVERESDLLSLIGWEVFDENGDRCQLVTKTVELVGDNPLYKLRGPYSPIYVPPEFDSLVIKTEDLFEFQNKVLSSSESDSVFNSELQALADKIAADRIASTGKSPQKSAVANEISRTQKLGISAATIERRIKKTWK